MWIVAYKITGGGATYTLLAYEEVASVALSSYNYMAFSNAVSGQSLYVAENDQILYGISFIVGDGVKYGRNTTDGSGMHYYQSGSLASGPFDLTVATDVDISETYDPGFTLVYTTLPGDVTAPSVAITTPAAAISIPVSTYTISGTASDETELDTVSWSCTESDAGDSLTVSEGAWSELIELAFGANTIVVRALDATGNTAQDTVTITQVNPTSNLSGAANF
jgi:hypothetical protein